MQILHVSLQLLVLTMLRSFSSNCAFRIKLGRLLRRPCLALYCSQEERNVEQVLEELQGMNFSEYWIQQLRRIEKRNAKELILQLVGKNAYAYDTGKREVGTVGGKESNGGGTKKTLLQSQLEWKAEHPDKVILVRVGEFYETMGVDAIMLVAHAGLNPMGGRARAGCPIEYVYFPA